MDSNAPTKDYVGVRKSLDGHSLGELEAQIMDIIWDLEPPITSTQVFKIMYPRRELSYSTIMLTMAKLSRKGILEQTRTGTKKTDAFNYKTNITRQQMGLRLMDEVAQKVLRMSLGQTAYKVLSAEIPGADQAKVEAAFKKAAK